MNDILKIFFSLSVSGSIITLILFSLKPFFKDKFSKTWQYYVWLIVIIRLLLPFSLEMNIVGQLFSWTDNMITSKNEIIMQVNNPVISDEFISQLPQIDESQPTRETIPQENVTDY